MKDLIDVDLVGANKLFNKLDRLLPPAEVRKLLKKVVRRIVTKNKQRIKKQENLDGSKFEPRKSGNGMMLENVFRQAKRKQYKVTATDRKATVEMLNPVTRRIHFGEDNILTLKSPSEIKSARGTFDLSGPCTDEQARLLRSQIGFPYPATYMKSRFTAFSAEMVLLRHYDKHGGKKRISQSTRDVLGINEKIEIDAYDTARKELRKIFPKKL